MSGGGDLPSTGAALVVGGSGGLGGAIAASLCERGAEVALTWRRNREGAEALAAALGQGGRAATAHPLDLEDPGSAQRLIDAVALAHGGLHTLVYAAGPAIEQPFISQTSAEQWRAAIDVELNGFFHLVRAAIPALRAARGSIVALSSAGVHRYAPGDILSVAPKAAIEALVRGVAREEGRFGVRANCVAVGVIEAGMFLRLKETTFSPEWLDAARRNTALRRFGTAAEVAEVVTFLASARAAYLTGQTLAVDGGYSL